jgi:two-component system sensor histidine kinase KdpD
MKQLFTNRISQAKQYLFSLLLVLLVSAICFALSSYMGYRVVALVLLLTVSLIAVSFDILPVLIAAALSAFIWDFFFISPRFTFHVSSTDDTILLIMYFVIAMVNAVLTYKIRQIEKIARQREEKANAVKLYNTLLNSLSHELKTPIATIIGATDNLQADNNNLSNENKQQLVSEIAKASFRLNEQVENLLNLSRLESGFLKPRKDWCDVVEIVYDMVKRIEENNISQRIVININPDLPLVRSDKTMLGQIVYNLLSNAVRYTPAGCTIHVSAMQFADLLQLVIEDNGKGFPEKDIAFVFEKFYLLENAANKGTGLGLSIVKGFTEALGGSVELQNLSAGGAKFTIHIPAESSKLKNLS